ncbi:MAG: N(4)-(beta-N-acetylglucosaminyl)-L-asparaginase [Bacteroidota bacterium]
MKRRKFLKNTTLAALPLSNIELAKPLPLPIVISTWPNIAANEAAWAELKLSKNALNAVEAGARIPEADPNDTSVGYGGLPDRDGHVTLDACIMDEKGNAGAVTFVEGFMHPISIARAVMEKTPHVMLSGKGAEQFALSQGFTKENLLTESSKEKWEEWKKKAEYSPKINSELHDTIGILAIDQNRDISAACTTSGLGYKMHGRVGDSPIIGASVFCDNEIGGAVATGLGEFVMKTLGSFLIVELMRNGKSPQKACEEAVGRIVKKYKNYPDFQVGYLAIDKKGNLGAFSIQQGFAYTLSVDNKTTVIKSKSYL